MPTNTSVLKSARCTPASRAAGARWRRGARQERAVRIVTLHITLVHLRRSWRSRSEGRIGFGAPMSTGALPVAARHERSRRRRSTSRHRACPPLQRRQSGQARNLRALGRGRCAQRRVAPVSAHFSMRASPQERSTEGRALPTSKDRERQSQSLERQTVWFVARFGENSDEQSRRVGEVSSEFPPSRIAKRVTSEEGGGACRPHKTG
jgi:hypothetical protein